MTEIDASILLRRTRSLGTRSEEEPFFLGLTETLLPRRKQHKKVLTVGLLAFTFTLPTFAATLEKPIEASQDTYYEEAFDVPAELSGAQDIIEKATVAQSVFQVGRVTNYSTGHGNAKFLVTYDSNADHWNLVIWSKDYNSGSFNCDGYRQWFRVDNPTFGSWTYNNGAGCVGWPATYNNMHENIQIIDHDADGDLDVFMMLETSPQEWTVYLYRNLEIN